MVQKVRGDKLRKIVLKKISNELLVKGVALDRNKDYLWRKKAKCVGANAGR